MELTEKQLAFLEFLLDPDSNKGSQNKWCRDNGVPERTACWWKKQPLFRETWEKRSYEIYGGPDRVNKVIEALHQKAINGDVRAAQLYLQYVDKFTPKTEITTPTKTLEELSDEELAALGDNITALRGRPAANS